MISIDEKNLSAILGVSVRIRRRRHVSGGSINHCELLDLDDGSTLFLKTHADGIIPGMYAAEAKALDLLARPGTLAVPAVIHAEEEFLLLEAFRSGHAAADWQEQMGRGLALLHLACQYHQFGFDMNNFLGTTPQPNDWADNWPAFWRKQRLEFQLDLFAGRTDKTDPLLRSGYRLLDNLDVILATEPEPAVLLHGDLWSGNAAADAQGRPVIYDPASYYGHREAEFGMMRLFGGFGSACEAAYQEVWPLQPEADRRIAVYRLYHQLNHLNLFGSGYYQGCLDTIKALL